MDNFDKQSAVAADSMAHTYANKQDDEMEMIEIISKIKLFAFKPGREYKSFNGIGKSPLESLNIVLLSNWLCEHKKKLFRSPYTQVSSEDEEENDVDVSEADVSEADATDAEFDIHDSNEIR